MTGRLTGIFRMLRHANRESQERSNFLPVDHAYPNSSTDGPTTSRRMASTPAKTASASASSTHSIPLESTPVRTLRLPRQSHLMIQKMRRLMMGKKKWTTCLAVMVFSWIGAAQLCLRKTRGMKPACWDVSGRLALKYDRSVLTLVWTGRIDSWELLLRRTGVQSGRLLGQ